MPEFRSPFSGLSLGRKLTDAELIRAIRFMIAAEYEAIQLCSQLAESTDNKLVIEVLKEISEDEREHAGSFLRLLYELDPEEEKYYKEGAEEVEEEIEDLLKDMKKTLKKKEEKPESKEDESEDKEEEKNETDD